MSMSSALAEVLAAGRPQFNLRVAEAKHRYPALDTQAFAHCLLECIDPMAQSVAAIAPNKVASVVVIAYDIALDLVGQALLGPAAKDMSLNRLWRDVLPKYAHLLAHDPMATISLMSNATLSVARQAGARIEQWLALMESLAQDANSIEHLKVLGQAAAWRSGMAHLREGVLSAVATLPAQLLPRALGAPQTANGAKVLEYLRNDRWWSAESGKRIETQQGIELGSFSGFGGTFLAPPRVRPDDLGFAIQSGDRFAYAVIDSHGGVLLAASEQEYAGAQCQAEQSAKLRGAQLEIKGRAYQLDLPQEGLQVVCNRYAAAVSSPFTFAVRFFPL
jgi:hypothetical protein